MLGIRGGAHEQDLAGGFHGRARLPRLNPLVWRPNSGRRFPHFFFSSPLAPAASSFHVSFLFLQGRQRLHTSLFPFLPGKLPAFPASPSLPPRKSTALCAPTLGAGPRPPRWAPPPPAASAAAPRAPAFPYLTWTNACRQSQEFRPLTSASSSQGTARETEGRGWGRREEGGGKAPTSSRSSLAEVSLFVCGFAPGPRASFPGISSFSERGTAGRCKVRSLWKQNRGRNPVT